MSKRKYKRIYGLLLCIAVFIIFTREPASVPEWALTVVDFLSDSLALPERAELLSDPERYAEGAKGAEGAEHALLRSSAPSAPSAQRSGSLKSSARSGSASESLRSGGRHAWPVRPTVHVWRSDFFGSRIQHREIRCGTLRCVWSSDGESTADVRVYHWVTHRKPSLNMKSPSVAMMLESEPNYGLIANYKAAGFNFSASPDPRSDFVRVAYPANMTKVMQMRSVRPTRIRGATFVARNCNKKRASLVSQVAKIFPVYSLSSCVPKGTIRAKMSGSKVDSIARYTHHLAFENSVSNGYVTEKIWDALKAGVTPIYYGAADVKRFVGFEPIRVENVLSAGVVPMFMAEGPRRDFVVPVETYKCDVCRLGQSTTVIWSGLSNVKSEAVAKAHMSRVESLMKELRMTWRLAVLVPVSTKAAVIAAYEAYGDVYIEKRVSGSRTQRLAKLRNQLFSLISGADYVIVNDFDAGVNTKPYKVASFKRAFELIGTWNGISFVVEPYWDLWALRERNVIPYDHWGRNRKKNKIRTPRDANRWLSQQSNEVVPVTSAFMMLVIYDPKVLRQRYDEKTLDCEHVSMHREFGKIGILRASLRV